MRRAWRVGSVAVLLAAVLTIGPPRMAGATGGGAGATGSGDTIISSILGSAGRSPRRSSGAPSSAPVCLWRTLTDRQVLFLLHVASEMDDLLDAAFLRALDRYLAQQLVTSSTVAPSTTAPAPSTPALPTTAAPTTAALPPAAELLDIQVQVCDGVPQTDQVRTVAVAVAPGSFEAAARDHLTRRREKRLDPPRLVTTPPVDAPSVVGEPTFFSLLPAQRELQVTDALTAWGRQVLVRAHPSNLSVFSGQPSDVGRVRDCKGFGTPFDPEGAHPHVQAVEGCAVWYADATGGTRRGRWLGYGELTWVGEYSIDGGATWSPIDGLYSFTVFQRQVDEVDTAIEDTPG